MWKTGRVSLGYDSTPTTIRPAPSGCRCHRAPACCPGGTVGLGSSPARRGVRRLRRRPPAREAARLSLPDPLLGLYASAPRVRRSSASPPPRAPTSHLQDLGLVSPGSRRTAPRPPPTGYLPWHVRWLPPPGPPPGRITCAHARAHVWLHLAPLTHNGTTNTRGNMEAVCANSGEDLLASLAAARRTPLVIVALMNLVSEHDRLQARDGSVPSSRDRRPAADPDADLLTRRPTTRRAHLPFGAACPPRWTVSGGPPQPPIARRLLPGVHGRRHFCMPPATTACALVGPGGARARLVVAWRPRPPRHRRASPVREIEPGARGSRSTPTACALPAVAWPRRSGCVRVRLPGSAPTPRSPAAPSSPAQRHGAAPGPRALVEAIWSSPLPESGTPAAIGAATPASGIPTARG